MLQRIKSDAALRKMLVFAFVFIIAGVVLGNQLANPKNTVYRSESVLLHAADGVSIQIGPARMASPQSSRMDLSSITPLMQPIAVGLQAARAAHPNLPFGLQGDTAEMTAPSSSDTRQRAPKDFRYLRELPISRDLQMYIYETCLDKDLEYELVLALMWRESGFDINAVNLNTNGTKDSGIMQINDINVEWLRDLGIHDLMDPMQNIDAGTTIFSQMCEKYGENSALMAYQYGETGMQELTSRGIYTTSHVQDVYARRDYYRELHG